MIVIFLLVQFSLMTATKYDISTDCPPLGFHVEGFWQPLQWRVQPCMKTSDLTSGPSLKDPVKSVPLILTFIRNSPFNKLIQCPRKEFVFIHSCIEAIGLFSDTVKRFSCHVVDVSVDMKLIHSAVIVSVHRMVTKNYIASLV